MVNLDTLLEKVNAGVVLALAFAVTCGLSATPASAQSFCLPHDSTVETLENKHKESQRLVAVTTGGSVVEFWANDETHTWTMFRATPDGLACILGAGDAWEILPKKPKGQGS